MRLHNILLRRKAYVAAKKEIISVFVSHCCEEETGDLEVQLLKADTFAEYKALIDKYCGNVTIHESYIESRFCNKDVFYCLVYCNDIVSTGWISTAPIFWIAEVDLFVQRKDENAAYVLYDFETKSQYRGKGYYPLLLRRMMLDFGNDNPYLIYAKKNNVASIRGIQKAGFQFIGDVSYDQQTGSQKLEPLGFSVVGRHYKFFGLYHSKKKSGLI